jgi:hypothetical protein
MRVTGSRHAEAVQNSRLGLHDEVVNAAYSALVHRTADTRTGPQVECAGTLNRAISRTLLKLFGH